MYTSGSSLVYLLCRFGTAEPWGRTTQSQLESLQVERANDLLSMLFFVLKYWNNGISLKLSTWVPQKFPGHVDGIAFLDPRGDGRHLISNSKDQTIKLWDIRSLLCLHDVIILAITPLHFLWNGNYCEPPFRKFSSSSAIKQGRREVSRQRWDYRWER